MRLRDGDIHHEIGLRLRDGLAQVVPGIDTGKSQLVGGRGGRFGANIHPADYLRLLAILEVAAPRAAHAARPDNQRLSHDSPALSLLVMNGTLAPSRTGIWRPCCALRRTLNAGMTGTLTPSGRAARPAWPPPSYR